MNIIESPRAKPSFETALAPFMKGAQAKVTANYAGTGLTIPQLGVTYGPKYAKIIRSDGGVYAFVKKDDGNVYKAASWTAPAKHARGNIYSPDGGLSAAGPYGMAYMR